MNELSERIAAEIFKRDGAGLSPRFQKGIATRRAEAAKLIEQALLAERALARRDAMEEAAKMCDEEAAAVDHVARCASDSAAYLGMSERLKIAAFKYMGSVLRAAAEKEGRP